jgi:hypothetical protein
MLFMGALKDQIHHSPHKVELWAVIINKNMSAATVQCFIHCLQIVIEVECSHTENIIMQEKSA